MTPHEAPTPGVAAGLASQGERLLGAMIETAMDAIIAVDARQNILVFNHAACEMFGWSAEEMLGQPLDRLIPLPSRGRHRELVEGFAASGASARPMGEPRTLSGLRRDGTEFPLHASISRVGSGDQALMTVVVRDASRQQQEQAERQAYAEAEAAHRARSEFLSRMGHELRTPLNAVLGLSRLLQASAQPRLTPTEHEQLVRVLAAAEKLHAMIEAMLASAPPAPKAAPAAMPPRQPAPPEPAGVVLYVEDDEVNALLVQQLLARWPQVRLAVAPDGPTGLALAQSLQPDLMLLDMRLPGLSGLQVLHHLKNDEATRQIPVVALSASAMPHEVSDALAAGALHYWTKPIKFPLFLEGVRNLLPPAA